jgi:hypothetical protein
MAMVMITCPTTGHLVPTGIETDPASIALIPPVNTHLTCPACDHNHVWSILGAKFDAPPFACTSAIPPRLEAVLEELQLKAKGCVT